MKFDILRPISVQRKIYIVAAPRTNQCQEMFTDTFAGMSTQFFTGNYLPLSHFDPPANGQAVIYLTGLLEVFISESFILATVSDNSVRYQAINVVKR